MYLVFTNIIDADHSKIYRYRIPEYFVPIIHDSLKLKSNQRHVFSFGNYSKFDANHHVIIIEYFFKSMAPDLEEKIVNETDSHQSTTYEFNSQDDIMTKVDKDDILFLYGLLHNLNLKPWLVGLANILMNHYNMELEQIKSHCQKPIFTMTMFIK